VLRDGKRQRVRPEPLERFCAQVFQSLDVPEDDARIAADLLVSADLRGIDSHGVVRLRRYVDRLRNGVSVARPRIQVVSETPATALIDAGAGLGQPASYRAMEKAIEKALRVGVGFVTVRNSNHYGIAGYYAMMALEHDCIGISMTTANVNILPTHGRRPMLGTNPIAVAAPAGREHPFVLDMATSVVARGKLEVYERLEKPLPAGWAADQSGRPMIDSARVLEGARKDAGWGLLPLGGAGELLGGHKGYGLAMVVEILCAILSGAAYADLVCPKTPEGKPAPSGIGHFFGAWSVDSFRPVDEFKADMDDLLRRLKDAPKAAGQSRIYLPGEKEAEEAMRRAEQGIPLDEKVLADLALLAKELGVRMKLAPDYNLGPSDDD